MLLLLVAFLAMLLNDALNALYVRWLQKRHVWRAGNADGLADVGALLAVGVTGAAIKEHGFSWWSAEAMVLIYVASVIGTVLGAALEERLDV